MPVTRLVLASASPRRRALLEALGLRPEVMVSHADEIFTGAPHEMVVINARAKRDEIAGRLAGSSSLVIAADTLVFLGDQPLGKPVDLDDAARMLRQLSGRTHTVITGLSVVEIGSLITSEGYESTDVTFRKLDETEIQHFVHAVRPVDRAGAYTVDGPGSLLVEGYRGCFYNVLGLPIIRLDKLLRPLGYSLFDMMEPERATFL